MRIALAVIVLALTGFVVVPTMGRTSVPLSDVKLVAEKSVPPGDFGAATKNGNRSRNRVGFAIGDLIAKRFSPSTHGGLEALVDVELR
jgi:hypothetical protein